MHELLTGRTKQTEAERAESEDRMRRHREHEDRIINCGRMHQALWDLKGALDQAVKLDTGDATTKLESNWSTPLNKFLEPNKNQDHIKWHSEIKVWLDGVLEKADKYKEDVAQGTSNV